MDEKGRTAMRVARDPFTRNCAEAERGLGAARVSSAGFSLVEALMAIVIMAFGLMFICQMMFVSLGGAALSRSKGTASLAAANQLEFLGDKYQQDPTDPDLSVGSHTPVQVEIASPNDSTKLNRFSVAWTVSIVTDPRAGTVLNSRLVTVTVTPIATGTTVNRRAGLNKAVSMTTIFSPKFL
jgi:Tfp pilus assembly protein PilV